MLSTLLNLHSSDDVMNVTPKQINMGNTCKVTKFIKVSVITKLDISERNSDRGPIITSGKSPSTLKLIPTLKALWR